jgi:hypothetical protein
MLTSEELENLDIFPKEYTWCCLMKFIFYSLSLLFSFTLLYTFYSDADLFSILTLNYQSKLEDAIINDYLTNELIISNLNKFNPDDASKFIQSYKDLETNFMKEYVMNSYPCLIKDSDNNFRSEEIIKLSEENLINNNSLKIVFEYKENPYAQFYSEDYQYLRTSYSNYIKLTKDNNKPNYYFLNKFDISRYLNNSSSYSLENFFSNNYLLKYIDIKNIYLNQANSYVVVWGHTEAFDEFMCITEGNLEFILIPPQEKKYVYPYTFRGPINFSRVNFFEQKRDDNNEKYADFIKANKFYMNVLQGDCIYIPAFWWRSYRTSKRKNIRTTFLIYKFNSNSEYLENIMLISHDEF